MSWREVEAFRFANEQRAAQAMPMNAYERARRARNLVWRHFRRLPAELVIACLIGDYDAGERLVDIRSHVPQFKEGAARVAADWLAEHGITWRTPVEKVPRGMATWRAMTGEEVCAALALSRCTFSIASFDKRFARSIGEQARTTAKLISPKQAVLLSKMVTRYRRQIRAEDLPASWRHLLTPPKETK